MIEKLVKEFEKIRISLTKSKKLIVADIDKIDEKYRKLAQEEKKSLTESLAVLNEQLKYYDKMLNGETIVDESGELVAETESSDEAQDTNEEPIIQDTIFPENNEPEEKKEDNELVEEKPEAEEKAPQPNETASENVFDWSNAEDMAHVSEIESNNVTEVTEEIPVVTTDENGWPIPEDWK